MARQLYDTLLSIDEWAHYMGVSPWEFNQITQGFPHDFHPPCENTWYTYSWQKDFISREEVAKAIDDAERAIAHEIGWFFGPKLTIDEQVDYPHSTQLRHLGLGYTPFGFQKSGTLNWDKFISGGIIEREEIGDFSITYSDRDSDGVQDTFTVTFPTTVTDTSEIALYFVEDNRLGEPISEEFRVRPVTVVIENGTATVKGHKSLCVIPALLEGVNPQDLDVADSIYVEEFTAARLFIDATYTQAVPNQGKVLWIVPPDCRDCGEITTGEVWRPLALTPTSPEKGGVQVNYAPGCEAPYSWEPDRALVSYISGARWENGRMKPEYARLVSYLSASFLPHEKCGCERSQAIMHHWRMKVNEGDNGRNFTQREIDSNPFGEPTLGALTVWKRISSLRSVHAVSLR